MKKIFDKKIIYGVVIGGILFGSIGVLATNYLYKSDQVSYSNDETDKTNVKAALDELYAFISENNNKNFKIIVTVAIGCGASGTYASPQDAPDGNTVTFEIIYQDGELIYPTDRMYSSMDLRSPGGWTYGFMKIKNIAIEYI